MGAYNWDSARTRCRSVVAASGLQGAPRGEPGPFRIRQPDSPGCDLAIPQMVLQRTLVPDGRLHTLDIGALRTLLILRENM
jgi:hypothetical protein